MGEKLGKMAVLRSRSRPEPQFFAGAGAEKKIHLQLQLRQLSKRNTFITSRFFSKYDKEFRFPQFLFSPLKAIIQFFSFLIKKDHDFEFFINLLFKLTRSRSRSQEPEPEPPKVEGLRNSGRQYRTRTRRGQQRRLKTKMIGRY